MFYRFAFVSDANRSDRDVFCTTVNTYENMMPEFDLWGVIWLIEVFSSTTTCDRAFPEFARNVMARPVRVHFAGFGESSQECRSDVS